VPGTDATLSAEAVVIGAHIDHLGVEGGTGAIFRGADDNASGTAMTLELIRGVRESGLVPARTLVFALFNGEEAGLIGSQWQVAHPVVPNADVVAMFSLDMVGAGDGSGVALYGATETANAWLADLMDAAAAEAGLAYVVERSMPLPLSDHAPYVGARVPAVMATTLGPHSTYHTPADTIDGILADDLLAGAELMWAELVPLALGTESSYLGGKSARTRSIAAARSFERLRMVR